MKKQLHVNDLWSFAQALDSFPQPFETLFNLVWCLSDKIKA
jgi:hypothetical protein